MGREQAATGKPEGILVTMNLHPQLAADCIVLGRFPLSTLLLMNDSNYPWCILVPDRDLIVVRVGELHTLPWSDLKDSLSQIIEAFPMLQERSR